MSVLAEFFSAKLHVLPIFVTQGELGAAEKGKAEKNKKCFEFLS
jgi:hypothetical protein